MASKLGSVDPSKHPDEEFDLYSIPAFDDGGAVRLQGQDIGSSKQIVAPGDILLSKIVPHIRRAWVVGPRRGRRIIASGEWIVFRSPEVDPRYLRHTLVSDPFHAEFMATVSGVGGSLLRARPVHVAQISIPLPPMEEQRRIADVLDRGHALRRRRRAVLAKLDPLAQSIFLDMFGDPATNAKEWRISPLDDLCSIAGEYGANVASRPFTADLPRYIRITDLVAGGQLNPERVSPSGPSSSWRQYSLDPGDVLFARSGATVGKTYMHDEDNGDCVFAGYLIRFRPDPAVINPSYLFHFTQTSAYRSWVRSRQRVVAQPNINAKQYGKELSVPVPPIELQLAFATTIAQLDQLRIKHQASLTKLDALFTSLQHRAFRGAL